MENCLATGDSLNRIHGQNLRIDIPLVGEHWFNHHTRTVTHGLHDFLIFDIDKQAKGINIFDNLLARLKPIHTDIFFWHNIRRNHLPLCTHQGVHRQVIPLGDHIIVKVMRTRNFHRARAKIRVRIAVGDDRDKPIRQRQAHHFSNDRRIAFITWVNRNSPIAQHRLGPRGGYGDIVPLFF